MSRETKESYQRFQLGRLMQAKNDIFLKGSDIMQIALDIIQIVLDVVIIVCLVKSMNK